MLMCAQRSIDSMGTREVAEYSTRFRALSLSGNADAKRTGNS